MTIAQSSVQFANKENSARVSVLDDILPLPPSFSSKTDEIPNSNESTSPSSNSMLRRSQGQLFHSKNAPDQTMLEEEDTCCLFFAPKSSEPVIKSHYPLFSHCSTDSNESSNVDVFQNYANQGLSESVENAPDNVDDFENENNVFMKCKDKSLLNINDFNHIQVVPTPPAPLVNSVQTEHESVCELTEDELELKALDEQEAMLKNQIIQNQIRELETPSRLDKPVSVSMIPKGSNFYTLETWKLEMNK